MAANPTLLEISQFNGSPRQNPAFNTSNPKWSNKVVGDKTFDGSKDHSFEWVSVLRPTVEQDDQVGLAGTAVKPDTSKADLPFTHPFGTDFEFTIVPDPIYDGLLASANKDPKGTYSESWPAARQSGISIPTGVLGVEIEAPLVPNQYRVAHGDRVAVYGRWIVDAGHPDFHTEIHPPLLMAYARPVDNSGNLTSPSASATTLFRLWSRPYQAGQLFKNAGDTGLTLRKYISRIAPTTGRIEAFPPVFDQPFQGTHIVAFTVRPPVFKPPQPGPAVAPTVELQCSYHFTVNGSCAVQVTPLPSADSVLVTLALNSTNYPKLPDPPSHFDKFSIKKLLSQVPGGADLGWIESEYLKIKKTLYVRRFAAPPTSQSQDGVNVVPFTPLNTLPRSAMATERNTHFPVYGWLKLQWVNIAPRIQGQRG